MLGSFGEVKWLGNIYIVLFCNAVFGVCASLALFNKFTARVRIAIVNRSVPENGRLPCPVTTTKRRFIDRFEVAIKALVPIDALRALLEHYRGVWRDGVSMSRKYVHNGLLAFRSFNVFSTKSQDHSVHIHGLQAQRRPTQDCGGGGGVAEPGFLHRSQVRISSGMRVINVSSDSKGSRGLGDLTI